MSDATGPWACCGEYMYTARSERDDEGTPVHIRRCGTCGRSVHTEERVLREAPFYLRADSARRRNRRYDSHTAVQCKVCPGTYARGAYGRHITLQRHQAALAARRQASGAPERQVLAQRLYRARQRTRRNLALVGAPPSSLPAPRAVLRVRREAQG